MANTFLALIRKIWTGLVDQYIELGLVRNTLIWMFSGRNLRQTLRTSSSPSTGCPSRRSISAE